MMPADRSKLSLRAALFLFILIGIPAAARSATLEDSAKELARKILAALPARENVQYEIRNASSLKPEDVARIEQALSAELQAQGLHVAPSGGASAAVAPGVVITLSENWNELVWTANIRQGEQSHAVLMAVPRPAGDGATAKAMPLTLHAEKFWDGPQRILDAGLITYGRAQSWLVLLLPDGPLVQNIQDGSTGKVDVPRGATASREPMGSLGFADGSNTIWFSLWTPPFMRICKVDLESQKVLECLQNDKDNRPVDARFPMMVDGAPAGPPPSGKGLELVIPAVCGGTSQFLASGNRDDTEPDSLQAFEIGPNGSVAISVEQNFPGPVVALHTGATPRAIVRNLTTGNYEAYRVAISCGQ
ncbi:MAG TPA: hypothetical protein VKT71_10965 [Candidatus Acidoferrales bacterium]|nr:hypothetical protein [Candidatus Acidoferrales bacterium]